MTLTGKVLQDYLAQQGDSANAAAASRYAWIINLSIVGTAFALLLVAFTGVFLVRTIIVPLRRIMGHFGHIAQGDLTDAIDVTGRNETGQVLTALASMQGNLKVILDQIRTASIAIEERSRQVQTQWCYSSSPLTARWWITTLVKATLVRAMG